MGGRVVGVDIGRQIVDAFLGTNFLKDHPNHPRRVQKLIELDKAK